MKDLASQTAYLFGEFRLDSARRILLKGDRPITLNPKAIEVLLALVERRAEVLSKDDLLNAVWPNQIVEENNLTVHISALRRALGEKRGAPQFIVTIAGRGYRFVASVREVQETDLDLARHSSISVVALAACVIGMGGLITSLSYAWISSLRQKMGARAMLKSIAVLPFKSLVMGNRDESLEMGMTDALITRLNNTRQIIVRPVSAVRRYTDLDQDAVAAGQELKVESVLEGTIQRVDEQLRMTARLVRIRDGETLWVETFDEKFTDIFAVQDLISNQIMASLKMTLGGEEHSHPASIFGQGRCGKLVDSSGLCGK